MTSPALHRSRRSKAVTQEARDGRVKWRAIFDTAQDGMLIADDMGRYVDANPAACWLFGMKRERILGRFVEDFADPLRKQEVRETWSRLLRQGHQKGLFRIYRPDGSTCFVEYRAKAHILPNENLCILRDITERNKAERSLRMREDRLRLEVDERKKAERALRMAKETAEAATLAKSQFIANISHEIRTPINGILGTLELLQQSPLSSEQKEYVGIMDDSGKTLMALINELLDFSRMEAGKLKLEIKSFDLPATLHAVIAFFSQRLKFKKVKLISKIAGGIPVRLRGDPMRLRQVLMNLIGNALKFTDHGQVIMTVSKQSEDEDAVAIKFSVQDTGPGISKDQQELLFRPFAQLDNSAMRPYQGTGLGLAISKQLVEHMGGSIGMHSIPGRGSTFWFSLPFEWQPHSLRTSPQESIATGMNLLDPAVNAIPKVKNNGSDAVIGVGLPRILVVEDNRINRLVVVRQLQNLGYAADTVANGAEAVDALKDSSYGLVLMDCQMPVMDGYHATQAIRKREKGIRTPIIAMTAHAMEEDRQRCLNAGMDDYISKPVQLERLRALLKERLSVANPIDLAQLKQAAPGSGDALEQLLNLYEKEIAEQIQALERAIQSRSVQKVRELAHSALGASVLLGMTAIATPLRRLEELGRRAELANAAELLQQIKNEFARTQKYLSQFQKEAIC